METVTLNERVNLEAVKYLMSMPKAWWKSVLSTDKDRKFEVEYLNQERKPRTNEREPHVAPRHYGRNLANTYVHSRVCYGGHGYAKPRTPPGWP